MNTKDLPSGVRTVSARWHVKVGYLTSSLGIRERLGSREEDTLYRGSPLEHRGPWGMKTGKRLLTRVIGVVDDARYRNLAAEGGLTVVVEFSPGNRNTVVSLLVLRSLLSNRSGDAGGGGGDAHRCRSPVQLDPRPRQARESIRSRRSGRSRLWGWLKHSVHDEPGE